MNKDNTVYTLQHSLHTVSVLLTQYSSKELTKAQYSAEQYTPNIKLLMLLQVTVIFSLMMHVTVTVAGSYHHATP